MSPDEMPTTPVEVEGLGEKEAFPWQSETLVWSFGALYPRLFGRPASGPDSQPVSPRANNNGRGTSNEQRVTVPPANPVAPPSQRLGLRSFEALSHWEGIVQKVEEDGFQARVIPFEDGKANPAKIEFADFSWDDLSISEEQELAVENAVFYWTIGRRRNVAGTYENVSLVRFRRLPSTNGYRKRLARLEAEELRQAYGDNGSD